MSEPVSHTVVVTNPEGLHLRPAHAFVSMASKFTSRIWVVKDAEAVDGNSILSLVTLGIAAGTAVEVRAEGEDAENAVASLTELLANLENLDHNKAEK